MQVTDHEALTLIITAFNKTVSNIIKLKPLITVQALILIFCKRNISH